MTDPQEMLAAPGSRMSIRVERSDERRRDQPDRTFSPEAVDTVVRELGMWVASRISRRFSEGRGAAQSMDVEINVKLDGDDDPITVPFRVTLAPDGSHRANASGFGRRRSG